MKTDLKEMMKRLSEFPYQDMLLIKDSFVFAFAKVDNSIRYFKAVEKAFDEKGHIPISEKEFHNLLDSVDSIIHIGIDFEKAKFRWECIKVINKP